MSTAGSGDIRLRLEGRFGGFRLDADAVIPGHGLTGLVGASGAGKTTLLRCLAGLLRTAGEVRVGEAVWQDARSFLPPHRRGVGYVFQEPSLLPHLSVAGNLRYSERRARGRPGPALDEVSAMLGVSHLLERRPDRLSGGERQRVAIARALLSRPSLLLMDEPLSSLDAAGKAEVLPYLETLHRELRVPVIYVSHDAIEVARLADRLMVMEAGRLRRADAGAGADPLERLSPDQVAGLARAALAAGLPPLPNGARP